MVQSHFPKDSRLLFLLVILSILSIGICALVLILDNIGYFKPDFIDTADMSFLVGTLASVAASSIALIGKFNSDTTKRFKQLSQSNQLQILESTSSELRKTAEAIRASMQDKRTVGQLFSKPPTFLDQLETMREMLDSFISSNSSNQLSTEYDSYAKREKLTAIVYDVVAILLAFSGAAVAFISSFNDSSLGAWSLVTRAAMAIGTFTASGFVFRRGTFHHREAKAAMRTALSLSQYRAFTANLPDDVKDQIEIDIAERVFSKGEIDHTEDRLVDVFSRRGVSISELSDLIKLFRETGAS